MKNIRLTLWGSLLMMSGLWLMAESLPEPFHYFGFRTIANQYSGIIAMGTMSLCMLLATRPVWLEKWLGGLDKGYRLHKWLGITALIATLTHFWFTHGTKWMVAWGWIARPNRQRRHMHTMSDSFSLEQWLGGFRKTAEMVGEYAFYLAMILLVMALVKRIPYHVFKKYHRWLAVTYLAFVFHTLVLFKFDYWTQPIGYLMAALIVVGTFSAILTLIQKIGHQHTTTGTIKNITPLPENNSIELLIDAPNWQGHQAGQFAFLHHATFSEPHPFTLASHSTPLRFLIKDLGDDTTHLDKKIHIGDEVNIEGAYGCFDFQDDADLQIWIATGIGITPFLARLSELAEQPISQPICLFYSHQDCSPILLNELQTYAKQANIRLILWHSPTQGRLNADIIKEQSGLTANSSIWYCGNEAFGKQLKTTFSTNTFHQELFAMR